MIAYGESNPEELELTSIRVVDNFFWSSGGGFDVLFKDFSPARPFLRLPIGDKEVFAGLIVQLGFNAKKAKRATVTIAQLGVDYLI